MRLAGLTVNIWLIRFLASGVTVSHSGDGYWKKQEWFCLSFLNLGMDMLLVAYFTVFCWFLPHFEMKNIRKEEKMLPSNTGSQLNAGFAPCKNYNFFSNFYLSYVSPICLSKWGEKSAITSKKYILTSELGTQHPFAGQNIQQLLQSIAVWPFLDLTTLEP